MPYSAVNCSRKTLSASRICAQAACRCAALSSSVQNVAIVSCEPDAVDARVTLLVSEAETCTISGCNLYGAPYSTYLDVRVDPISGKVISATLAHASNEDATQSGK